jgi:beta-lactam-binding protein with PASTA domain/serine/threonine protein kinase
VDSSDTSEVAGAAPAELVSTLFADRFNVARLASDGANTAIFDAVDTENGRLVTLKLVRPQLAASPSFRKRFDETMRAVGAMSHQNVAAVYDWGIARVGDSSTAYVVTELLTGGSMRDMLDRGRRLSPSQALAVGLDACRGLDYAHRRGFVHGELTPSKLVFGDDRRLRIVDFGLARQLGEPQWEQPHTVDGHVAWYASPEQGLGQPIDAKTDIYALSLVLYEAVTGELPFSSDSTVASLSARVGRLMPMSADLGSLASVLEHAGRPEADERASAAEFGRDLVQIASQMPRPGPLPLLSTDVFEMPVDQMRKPEDPTGGVGRPLETAAAVDSADPFDPPETAVDTNNPERAAAAVEISAAPEFPTIIESEPDSSTPAVDQSNDLIILPLDTLINIEAPREAEEEPSEASPPMSAPTRQMSSIPPPIPPQLVRRRSFPWKILLGFLVLGALAVLGVLATRLFETPTFVVPDLVERQVAEARNLIVTNDWLVEVEEERSDLVPTPGQVVRTAPQAGVELAEGEPFLMVVSLGPTLRELPESVGALFSEVQTRLLARGLAVALVEVFHEEIPKSVVIEWSVPGDPTLVAGAFVEPGTLVQLQVSNGPEPRVMPDMVNVTLEVAQAAIDERALLLSEAEPEFSDEFASGLIISQSIPPTTEVVRGTEVVVVISLGPDVVGFPDLSGAATFEQAAVLLAEAGFEARLVFGDSQGEIREYGIGGRTPEVGELFPRGSLVTFEAL